jgi:hypothetical protein
MEFFEYKNVQGCPEVNRDTVLDALLFAYDQVLLFDSEHNLRRVLYASSSASELFEMEMPPKKSK